MKILRTALAFLVCTLWVPLALGTIVSISAWYKKDAHTDRLVAVIGDSPAFKRQADTEHCTYIDQFLGTIAAGTLPTHLVIEGLQPSDITIAQYVRAPHRYSLHQALQCKARQFSKLGSLTQTLSCLGGMYTGDMSNLFAMLENSDFLAQTCTNMLIGRDLSISNLAEYAKERGANLAAFNSFITTMPGTKKEFFDGPWEKIKEQVRAQAHGTTALDFLGKTREHISQFKADIGDRHDDRCEQTVLLGLLSRLERAHEQAFRYFLSVFAGDLSKPCLEYMLCTIENAKNFDAFLAINNDWLQTLVFDMNEAAFITELLDLQKPQKVIMFLDTYSAVSLGDKLRMLGFVKLGQEGLEGAQMNGLIMPNEEFSLTPAQLQGMLYKILYNKW